MNKEMYFQYSRAIAFLSQARNLRAIVDTKLSQLESLRSLASRVTSSFESTPVSHTRNVSSMEDTIMRMDELLSEVDHMIAIRGEIMDVLTRVPDANCRLVLEKRYLQGLMNCEIAVDMHFSDRWVQIRHVQGLAMVDQILQEREDQQEQESSPLPPHPKAG